jgi:hypothetical protein
MLAIFFRPDVPRLGYITQNKKCDLLQGSTARLRSLRCAVTVCFYELRKSVGLVHAAFLAARRSLSILEKEISRNSPTLSVSSAVSCVLIERRNPAVGLPLVHECGYLAEMTLSSPLKEFLPLSGFCFLRNPYPRSASLTHGFEQPSSLGTALWPSQSQLLTSRCGASTFGENSHFEYGGGLAIGVFRSTAVAVHEKCAIATRWMRFLLHTGVAAVKVPRHD